LILQIGLGAVLTALGSVEQKTGGVVVTVLAAVQTVIAGLLALVHDSGWVASHEGARVTLFAKPANIGFLIGTSSTAVSWLR
jgi:hypothetical protein